MYLRNATLPGVDKNAIRRPRAVLLASGVDIAVVLSDHRLLNGSIGQQVHFMKRWVVPDDMRRYMVSEQMVPKLNTALAQQLDKIRTALAN
jgi:hypothetical protein